MSTLIPSSQEPVTLQDKSPQDTPKALKSDNPSFVLHGIDNVVYENVSVTMSHCDSLACITLCCRSNSSEMWSTTG